MKILALMTVSALVLCGAAHADISISSKPTQNMNCDAGVCTATAKKANLNLTDLTNMLAAGDTTVKFGGGALAIQVLDSFSWTNTSRLTLDANTSVGFHKPVTVAGQGAFTITYNDGGSDGDLKIFDNGKIDFWNLSSSLIINGNSYTLVGDIKTLATDISANPDSDFALAIDYDAKHDKFHTVPIPGFGGILEGLGHGISHLKFQGGKGQCSDCSGMIAFNAALVRDFALRKVDVNSVNETYVGALAGFNEGLLVNVSVDGTVRGSYDTAAVGGLVGENEGKILRSRSLAAVSATSGHGIAGGLVGSNDYVYYNYISIDQSYATGAVSGTIYAGGLTGVGTGVRILDSYATGAALASASVGSAGGLVGFLGRKKRCIETSYSLGSPSGGLAGGVIGYDACSTRVPALYWDTDTSGTNLGCGYAEYGCAGIGLSDMELKSGLPEGFDPTIWGQLPNINNGYPYLLANLPR